MQKDYARRLQRKQRHTWNRTSRKRPRSSKRSGILIALIILLLCGCFAWFLFYVHLHFSSHPLLPSRYASTLLSKTSIPKQREASKSIATTPTATPAPTTQFDFYNMLPKIEVAVDQNDTQPVAKAATHPATPTPEPTIQANTETTPPVTPEKTSMDFKYVLQVASVSSSDEAKNIQNTLVEKGFVSRIIPLSRGEQTWYRIQIGPFSNKIEAEATKTLLQRKKIHSILIANET